MGRGVRGESANQANDLNLQAQAQIVPDRHTHTDTHTPTNSFRSLERTPDGLTAIPLHK